jgi:hypothetical protein
MHICCYAGMLALAQYAFARRGVYALARNNVKLPATFVCLANNLVGEIFHSKQCLSNICHFALCRQRSNVAAHSHGSIHVNKYRSYAAAYTLALLNQ